MSGRLARHGGLFVLVGLAQLAVDSSMFALLHALTGATVAANLASRATAAGIGFWANGRYTFSEDGVPKLGGRRFMRYVVTLLVMTVLSTLALKAIEWQFGGDALYLGKPLVEAALAALGFLVARAWIYD